MLPILDVLLLTEGVWLTLDALGPLEPVALPILDVLEQPGPVVWLTSDV